MSLFACIRFQFGQQFHFRFALILWENLWDAGWQFCSPSRTMQCRIQWIISQLKCYIFKMWLSYFRTAIGEASFFSHLPTFMDIKSNCKLRSLCCCHCWGFQPFLFQYHWLFWFHADWFVYFSCIPNCTLKSFSFFFMAPPTISVSFSSSWQDSAPPVPALVGTWQPQWKAAGRTVLEKWSE